MSFYKRYRPRTLKGIVGQDGAIASLQRFIDKGTIPHCILFSGPSGVGKTTLGRILKTHLNCGDADFLEINSADFKGIDTIREIRRSVNLSPISGDCRIWFIDEAHKLTGDAQNALLKMLEDTPDHVYFMLATTDPQKLIKTIHTRASEVKLQGLGAPALQRVLQRVVDKEKLTVTEKVLDEIIDASDNSARKALVILEQVGSLDTEAQQLEAVSATSLNKDAAITLARALINPRADWKAVALLLKELKDEPEGIRYLVLGYCRSVLLGGGPLTARAYMIIDIFSRNFYDSKSAGLAAACYEVVHGT
jgi:DNA polymerase III gamma/tau subunit